MVRSGIATKLGKEAVRPEGHKKSHRSKIATKIIKPQKLWKTVKLEDYNKDRMLQDSIDKYQREHKIRRLCLHDGIDVGLVRDHKLTFVWW